MHYGKKTENVCQVKEVLQGSEAWKRRDTGGYVFWVYASDA